MINLLVRIVTILLCLALATVTFAVDTAKDGKNTCLPPGHYKVFAPGGIGIYLLSRPDSNAKNVTTIPNQSLIEVTKSKGDWSFAKGELTGWVLSRFLLKTHMQKTCKVMVPYPGQLRLQMEPNSEAHTITFIPDSSTVAIRGGFNDWTSVSWKYEGWMRSKFLNTSKSADVNVPIKVADGSKLSSGNYRVNSTSGLKVRTMAKESARIITHIPVGSTIRVYGSKNNWSLVKGHYSGWMSSKLLKKTKSKASKYKVKSSLATVTLFSTLGKNRSVVTSVPNKTTVSVVKRKKLWSLINWRFVGWVPSDSLSKLDEVVVDSKKSSTLDDLSNTCTAQIVPTTYKTTMAKASVKASDKTHVKAPVKAPQLPTMEQKAKVVEHSEWGLVSGYHKGWVPSKLLKGPYKKTGKYKVIDHSQTVDLLTSTHDDPKVIAKLKSGTVVVVDKIANDWISVWWKGTASANFTFALQPDSMGSEWGVVSTYHKGRVPAKYLKEATYNTGKQKFKLHVGPSEDTEVITTLPSNSTIIIEQTINGWSLVGWHGMIPSSALFVMRPPVEEPDKDEQSAKDRFGICNVRLNEMRIFLGVGLLTSFIESKELLPSVVPIRIGFDYPTFKNNKAWWASDMRMTMQYFTHLTEDTAINSLGLYMGPIWRLSFKNIFTSGIAISPGLGVNYLSGNSINKKVSFDSVNFAVLLSVSYEFPIKKVIISPELLWTYIYDIKHTLLQWGGTINVIYPLQ